MSSPSDRMLVERAAAGDAGAAALLCERYFGSLYDFVARTALSTERAGELVREALQAALTGLAGLPDGEQVRPWLFGIARDVALEHLIQRRRGRRRETADFAAVDPASLLGRTDIELARALGPAIWEAAATLDARQRSLLDLQLRHGFGAGEIAAVLGVTRESGEVTLTRIQMAAEEAFAAAAMLADGPGCAGLAATHAEASAALDTRHTVSEHIAGCTACSARRQAFSPLDIFGAFEPVAASEHEKARVLDALRAEWPAVAAGLAAEPNDGLGALLRRPGRWTSRALLRGVSGLGIAAGLLLLAFFLPVSPIALTGNGGPRQVVLADADVSPPPGTMAVIQVTPPATPTPARSATPVPSGTSAAAAPRTATPEHLVAAGVTPAPVESPTVEPSNTATATLTPTATPPPGTPTPIPCTPGLSSNVSVVNASGGSSSFELYNSYCRALDFDISSAALWIDFEPLQGHLETGAHRTISVTAKVSQLPEGTTTGMIQVMWPNGAIPVAVQVTREGRAPAIGEVTAQCSRTGTSGLFRANVTDDFAVASVVVYFMRPDGTSGASGLVSQGGGVYEGAATGPIASYTLVATDHANHSTQIAGACE